MCMPKAKTPTPAPVPASPDPAPTEANSKDEINRVKRGEQLRQRAAALSTSGVATSNQGVLGTANVGKKTLLGQ